MSSGPPQVAPRAARAGARGGSEGLAIDLVAFALGLGCAWWLEWTTTDLVWSLWASSLAIGYASLLFAIATEPQQAGASRPASAAAKLFLVLFFTVHFGGFHFVHSVFLNLFFPIAGGQPGSGSSPWPPGGFWPGLAGYAHVFASYWPWLVVAAIAEHRLWRRPPPDEAAAAGALLFRPYGNVVRLHLLIFFFAGAALLGIDGFAVYVVIYAAYFLPWRAWLSRSSAPTDRPA